MKHGDSVKGSEYNNLFGIWGNMRDRCNRDTHKDAPYYKEKGITVEKEWDQYPEFKKWSLANGYEPKKKLQIDRKDSDKNYTPTNCRWVTPKVNQRNRKCIKLSEEKANDIRKLFDEKLTDKEIAKKYDVRANTINNIRRGRAWNP